MQGDQIWDISTNSGSTYRLLLYVPPGGAPASGWPILYMTDGNAVFATARDTLRVQASYPSGSNVEFGVIAAIGYTTDDPYDFYGRSWDLSPPPGRSYPPFREGGAPVLTGGAAAFLETVEEIIKPRVQSHLPIDPRRQTLFGHSFGGLFTLYSLFTHPGTFRTYVAASPSLYWEDESILAMRDPFLASCAEGPAARVLLSAGQYEGDRLPPYQRDRADADKLLAHRKEVQIVAASAALSDMLNAKSRGRIQSSFEVFSKENHMSVLPVAVNRAVQAAFSVDSVRSNDVPSAPMQCEN